MKTVALASCAAASVILAALSMQADAGIAPRERLHGNVQRDSTSNAATGLRQRCDAFFPGLGLRADAREGVLVLRHTANDARSENGPSRMCEQQRWLIPANAVTAMVERWNTVHQREGADAADASIQLSLSLAGGGVH